MKKQSKLEKKLKKYEKRQRKKFEERHRKGEIREALFREFSAKGRTPEQPAEVEKTKALLAAIKAGRSESPDLLPRPS